MGESFLQFLWKHQLHINHNLKTTDGLAVQTLSTGFHNTDSGPDFFNAKIKIDETIWAGNVEIHTKSSDWFLHNHQNDKAYDNVILHVVKENDKPAINTRKQTIPTLILPYEKRIEENYSELMKSKGWIACHNEIKNIESISWQLWVHSLMIERLESKTDEIIKQLEHNKNDWNETFYQFLARNFGFKTNALPFEMLAKAIPLSILGKHKNNLFQLEALLFGTAGLLNEELIGDDYFLALRKEFGFLFRKYHLKPLESHIWKFLRLRPSNFPTIRIAQFARLIHYSSALFSRLIELEDLKQIKKLFDTNASEYWDTHYRFNKESKKQVKHLGDNSFHNIVINTLLPFLFVYGDHHNKQHLKDRALEILEQIPAEKNSVISKWEQLGLSVQSSFDSQALIQLKNCYCNAKNCLNCPIGTKLISRTSHEKRKFADQ